MKKTEIEKKLQDSFLHLAPDNFDSVLDVCRKEKKITETKKPKKIAQGIIGIAAALILVVAGSLMIYYRKNVTAEKTVYVDVNPSIMLKVNKKDIVIRAEAVNDDGGSILLHTAVNGLSLESAVASVTEEMIDEGYITSEQNSILVSIEGRSIREAWSDTLTARVTEICADRQISSAVVTQIIDDSERFRYLAEKYDISVGRAKFISEISEKDGYLTPEELSERTVHELSVLAGSHKVNLKNGKTVGNPDVSGYVGGKKALSVALAHAGYGENDVTEAKGSLEIYAGKLVYDVEFAAEGFEFEYKVDAVTGEILLSEKEKSDDESRFYEKDRKIPAEFIGEDKALAIALAHADVRAEAVLQYQIKLDKENGFIVYEVEFETADAEYEYDIKAAAGDIIKYEKDGVTGQKQENLPASGYKVREASAKASVIADANADPLYILAYRCKTITDNGEPVYEISFIYKSQKYRYEVSAETGTILEKEVEAIGNGKKATP